jgi:hypothetical protein
MTSRCSSARRARSAARADAMTQDAARFPPDVAAALRQPSGRKSLRYTRARTLTGPQPWDLLLMSTPWPDGVFSALVLDTKLNLRFVRAGCDEGTRVALVNVGALIELGAKHWDIALEWDPDALAIEVRDQQDTRARPLRGTWVSPL